MNKYDIASIEEKINKCKNININQVNINEIDDIENLKINSEKSSVERILDFLNACKNPYFFNVNGMIVQFDFSSKDIKASECVSKVLKNEFKK